MSNRGVKIGLLVLTLGLPVALYLFLQGFGKNQYDVPIFYQEGINIDYAICSESTAPHTLPEVSWKGNDGHQLTTSNIRGQLSIFSFLGGDCEHQGAVLEEMARVANNYRNDTRVGCLSIIIDSTYDATLWESARSSYNFETNHWTLLHNDDATGAFLTCGFNLPVSCEAVNQLVLVDGQLRIRGYYTANDRQEVDRLITEIEILLRNEEDV